MPKSKKDKIEIIREFLSWGSGFTLEAERDYDNPKKPYIYHLTMHGLWFDGEEYIGTNIISLMKKAIKTGKFYKKHYENWEKKEKRKNHKPVKKRSR